VKEKLLCCVITTSFAAAVALLQPAALVARPFLLPPSVHVLLDDDLVRALIVG